MCELFAMSSLYPTTVTFSLNEFSKHGGFNGPHKDGWGVAYYEDNDVRILKDEKYKGVYNLKYDNDEYKINIGRIISDDLWNRVNDKIEKKIEFYEEYILILFLF